ncbi:MAG: hypothetical protein M1840_003805 [Geoglossum simile]|nr:MAG: hypothetical protein M1840_003805 [Geoglossum simile]
MSDKAMRVARVVSVVAATMISLSCGTNYVYSAWAPQFAERLRLSSTESNLIGTAANLGMYASGIPVGILVDSKGPRLSNTLLTISEAYDLGPGAKSVPILCFFSLLTGIGSCAAFSASLKSAALNFPHHRGTATAFPLAAFGLSAFFFSTLSSLAFPGNTSDFLFLLAVGTFTIVFVSLFFLRVIPHPAVYDALPDNNTHLRTDSNQLRRPKSAETRRSLEHELVNEASAISYSGIEETSSLISSSSSSSPGDVAYDEEGVVNANSDNSHHLDIRGMGLLPKVEFWQLFILMGLLTGVGLMTINNIGNDAQALWSHYDDSADPKFIQKWQAMHVSILSLMSFAGRLISGVGSDLIVKKLGMSRFWCLVASSSVFSIGQICAMNIENPHHLWAVSGLTGLAYGFLFGVFPTMVSEAFGVHGLSQNWGCMTLAPVISGNIFNLLYGSVYDHHSNVLPGGERDCPDGLQCYRSAYLVTFGSSLAGVAISLWCIHAERKRKARRQRDRRVEGREA